MRNIVGMYTAPSIVMPVLMVTFVFVMERSWRFQRGNQHPLINEGQTTQWLNQNGQKFK
jgi:hypothetical protein